MAHTPFKINPCKQMKYKLEIPLSPELEKYRDKIEYTIKPYVEITIQNNDQVDWWQSKFGGLPYLPKNFEYPTTPDGKYLFLLAQINFSEVPSLESFPKKGILQFYIADDDLFGSLFLNPTDGTVVEGGYKMLYFPEPDFNRENITLDYDFLPEPEYFPLSGCCSLQFIKKYAPISTKDYRFKKLMGEEFCDLYKTNREINEEYGEITSQAGHKIGGYPDFFQSDPRVLNSHNEQDPDLLLFQMDGEENDVIHIGWGDGGVANFFIYESELKRLDFSEVYYTWDCG